MDLRYLILRHISFFLLPLTVRSRSTVLFCSHSGEFSGGAQKCLIDFLENTSISKDKIIVQLPEKGNLVDTLKEIGIKTTVVPKKNFQKPHSERSSLEKLLFLWNRLIFGLRFAWLIKRTRPCLVYVNTMSNNTQSLASKLFGVPVILHNHGLFYAWKKKIPLVSRTVDEIIVVSNHEKNLLKGHLEQKIHVVHNGVDPALPYTKRPKLPGKLKVGMVSAIIKHKGVDIFCELARKTPKASFIHVGKPTEYGNIYFEDLQKEYAKEIEKKQLYFAGFRKNVYDYLNSFDIFLFPSREEGFPLVVLEAMNFSKPVITFNLDGRKEQIINGKSGYLCENKKEMQTVLKKLIKDKKLRLQVGKQARIHVKNNFTLDAYVKGIEKVMSKYLK